MATWAQLAVDNFAAAGELYRSARYRSSVSRAYFASFAAVSEALVARGLTFADGREAPSHAALRGMVEDNLGSIAVRRRQRLKSLLNVCYEQRLQADYRPRKTIDRVQARNAVINASQILGLIGIEHEHENDQ